MSEELTMDQKIEMLREARGIGGTPVSRSDREERERMRDAVRREMGKEAPPQTPFTQSTTVVKTDTKKPDPFPRRDRSSSGESSHPWKVTCSENNATVAPGILFSIQARNNSAGFDIHGWDFVEQPKDYPGGELTGLTGTQYLYARCGLSALSGSSYVYSSDVGGNTLETRVYVLEGDVEVYASTMPPDQEGVDNSGGSGWWIKPLAKVVVTDGVAVVEKQYLTHNPSIHVNLLIGAV